MRHRTLSRERLFEPSHSCLEYWSKLVADLYEEIQSLPMTEPLLTLNLGGGFGSSAASMLGNLSL